MRKGWLRVLIFLVGWTLVTVQAKRFGWGSTTSCLSSSNYMKETTGNQRFKLGNLARNALGGLPFVTQRVPIMLPLDMIPRGGASKDSLPAKCRRRRSRGKTTLKHKSKKKTTKTLKTKSKSKSKYFDALGAKGVKENPVSRSKPIRKKTKKRKSTRDTGSDTATIASKVAHIDMAPKSSPKQRRFRKSSTDKAVTRKDITKIIKKRKTKGKKSRVETKSEPLGRTFETVRSSSKRRSKGIKKKMKQVQKRERIERPVIASIPKEERIKEHKRKVPSPSSTINKESMNTKINGTKPKSAKRKQMKTKKSKSHSSSHIGSSRTKSESIDLGGSSKVNDAKLSEVRRVSMIETRQESLSASISTATITDDSSPSSSLVSPSSAHIPTPSKKKTKKKRRGKSSLSHQDVIKMTRISADMKDEVKVVQTLMLGGNGRGKEEDENVSQVEAKIKSEVREKQDSMVTGGGKKVTIVKDASKRSTKKRRRSKKSMEPNKERALDGTSIFTSPGNKENNMDNYHVNGVEGSSADVEGGRASLNSETIEVKDAAQVIFEGNDNYNGTVDIDSDSEHVVEYSSIETIKVQSATRCLKAETSDQDEDILGFQQDALSNGEEAELPRKEEGKNNASIDGEEEDNHRTKEDKDTAVSDGNKEEESALEKPVGVDDVKATEDEDDMFKKEKTVAVSEEGGNEEQVNSKDKDDVADIEEDGDDDEDEDEDEENYIIGKYEKEEDIYDDDKEDVHEEKEGREEDSDDDEDKEKDAAVEEEDADDEEDVSLGEDEEEEDADDDHDEEEDHQEKDGEEEDSDRDEDFLHEEEDDADAADDEDGDSLREDEEKEDAADDVENDHEEEEDHIKEDSDDEEEDAADDEEDVSLGEDEEENDSFEDDDEDIHEEKEDEEVDSDDDKEEDNLHEEDEEEDAAIGEHADTDEEEGDDSLRKDEVDAAVDDEDDNDEKGMFTEEDEDKDEDDVEEEDIPEKEEADTEDSNSVEEETDDDDEGEGDIFIEKEEDQGDDREYNSEELEDSTHNETNEDKHDDGGKMSMVDTESGEDKDRNLGKKEETQVQECYQKTDMGDLISKNGGSTTNELHTDEVKDDGVDDDIIVSVVTWNMAELSPSEEEANFLKAFRSVGGEGSDIVLIGTQETENVKPRRSEGSRSRELRRLAIKMLGKQYVPLAIHSLGGVQMALFCKRSILDDVEFVSVSDVPCGIGNVFHNKGAIGAYLQMKARNGPQQGDLKFKRKKSIKMLLVCCHLAAHVKKLDSRNEDYWRIASELETQAPARFLPPHSSSFQEEDTSGGEHLMKSMDRIFVCGDLNYRIDLPRETVEKTIRNIECILNSNGSELLKQKEAAKIRLDLLRNDQLLRILAEDSAFIDLTEGEIKFPPTFKFDKGTKTYDTSHKQRIPAWTDRVLFKPFGVRVLEYDSAPNAVHSDHRPVFANMKVNMMGAKLDEEHLKSESKKKRSIGKRKRLVPSNESPAVEVRPKRKKRRVDRDEILRSPESEHSLGKTTLHNNSVESNIAIKRKRRRKRRKEF